MSNVEVPGAGDDNDVRGGDAARGAQLSRRITAAIAFVAFGIAVCVWTVSIGIGTPSEPGPGFWPFILGVVSIAAAVIFAVVSRDSKGEPFTRSSLVGAGLMISVGVFIVLMQQVHFTVAAAFLLVVGQLLAGERRWIRISVVTVVATAACWFLFFELLGVPTPRF